MSKPATLSTASNFSDPDAAYRAIVEAHRGLSDEQSAALDTALAAWVVARAANYSASALDLNEVHNLMELDMELSQGYGKWARRLERDITRKVKAKLEAEVRAELLIKLLDHRFGPLPEDIAAKVLSASVQQIEEWARRVLYAQRLDDVFLC